MKIAAVLTCKVSAGGGFNQALNAIQQMKKLSEGKYDFVVYTNIADNIQYLSTLGVNVKSFSFSLKDKILSYSVSSKVVRQLQSRFKLIGRMEKEMLSDSVDLVYFVTPSALSFSLQRLNYITTLWDLCHRDTPEFPEVRNFGEFYTREHMYQHCLSPAILVLTDSVELNNRIVSRYGIDKDKLLCMPFSPSPFTIDESSTSLKNVLKKYKIEKGYHFYPAQFWSHKNHIRILQALSLLVDKGMSKNVVFAGGDQGNMDYIKNMALKLGVSEFVRILGFVPHEDMRGLYEGCQSVVMPTYFGPTNLPPLEAWSIGKPLIYSSHLYKQAGNAALLVDPDDSNELAKAMMEVVKADVSEKLIDNGKQRLLEINKERLDAELLFSDKLKRYALRNDCWC